MLLLDDVLLLLLPKTKTLSICVSNVGEQKSMAAFVTALPFGIFLGRKYY